MGDSDEQPSIKYGTSMSSESEGNSWELSMFMLDAGSIPEDE